LRLIKSKGFTHVVLEATSHGLDQHRLLGTNITLGILTNITHEHLDYHPTFSHYQKAKAKLFAHAKVAFLNQDDQSFTTIKALLPPTTRLIPYSRKSKSPYQETIKKTYPQTYNQSNALAVTALGEYLGISPDLIIKTLSQPVSIPGRLESIPNSRDLQLIVDFAHTPNALTQV
jgi:UDP-N-acetylmuramoyl-L-alanyl-D-glutamate--2,6-diaminopimelate ligase